MDNSATTRPAPEVVQAVVDCMEKIYGNPSSLHRKGVEAGRILNRTRETVAGFLGAQPGEIVFTSGGTESNNLAIKGAAYAAARRGRHIITTEIEHPAVLNVCRALEKDGFEIEYLPVNKDGIIDSHGFRDALRQDTILVSTMCVNNEIGSMQPLKEISKHIRDARGKDKIPLWHVDAVQAFGKLPLNPEKLGINLLSVSAHKMHGPRGIGALYVSEGTNLTPVLNGGGQEKDMRPGTENIPAAAGFMQAVNNIKDINGAAEHMAGLRRRLAEGVQENIPDCSLNGPLPGSDFAAPHILNISFNGVRGEVLLHLLEDDGIYVSTGSACSSRKPQEQGVLKALGLNVRRAEGALRFSFSPWNNEKEIDFVLERLKEGVEELRSLG